MTPSYDEIAYDRNLRLDFDCSYIMENIKIMRRVLRLLARELFSKNLRYVFALYY